MLSSFSIIFLLRMPFLKKKTVGPLSSPLCHGNTSAGGPPSGAGNVTQRCPWRMETAKSELNPRSLSLCVFFRLSLSSCSAGQAITYPSRAQDSSQRGKNLEVKVSHQPSVCQINHTNHFTEINKMVGKEVISLPSVYIVEDCKDHKCIQSRNINIIFIPPPTPPFTSQ